MQYNNQIQIFIKSTDNKSHAFFINSMQTVEDLMQNVCDKLGFPINVQSLIYQGKRLNKINLISEYGMKNESNVYLNLLLLGGMPRKKQFRYCEAVLVHETYSPSDYDRSYKSYSYENASSYGGYSTGSSNAYSTGSSNAYSTGSSNAYSTGSSNAYSTGSSTGYSTGSSNAYSSGYK